MALTFHIPGTLRTFTSGRDTVEIAGSPATVGEALAELWALYPGIRDRVATEQGLVREHVNIFVGEENIRYTGGLATRLTNGSEISIVLAVSGGRPGELAAKKRPILVTALSCLLIVTGIAGMIMHAGEIGRSGAADAALVETISALAVIAGVFMIRGNNWARWLAMIWIAFHVVISFFHPIRQLLIHIVVFSAFAFVLFRANSVQYFRAGPSD